MSRHQLPGCHGNPLTLADGLSSNDSLEIWWELSGGERQRKVGIDGRRGVRITWGHNKAKQTCFVKG